MIDHEAEVINEAVQHAWNKGWQIDDGTARRIAERIGPGTGPLHALARTGAIASDLSAVLQAMAEETSGPNEIWIAALDQYCRHRQRKGPIPNWDEYSQ